MAESLLPHNEKAERAVISSMLIDPDAIFRVMDAHLKPEHFYIERFGWVYEAVLALERKNKPIDYVAVGEELDRRGQLDAIGGSGQLTRMISEAPTSVNAKYYAEIVRENALRRRLIGASGQIADVAQNGGSIDEVFADASRVFWQSVEQAKEGGSHLHGGEEAALWYLTKLADAADRLEKNPQALIRIGLPSVDRFFDSIDPGILHVVAARTSVGKTIWLEQLAEHNARRGHNVVFYHFELSHLQMWHRQVARYSGVPIRELRRGVTNTAVSNAINRIKGWSENMTWVECPGWSVDRVISDMGRLHAQGRNDLTIVDYLGKIALSGDDSRANALQGAVEGLKTAAEQYGIPIALGSQVSRAYKQNRGQRPSMNDTKGSSAIENRANQVVVLWRKVSREEQEDSHEEIGVSIEKNTTGSTGETSVYHLKGRFSFVEKEDLI